jgi:carbamoyltransferase
MRILGINEGLNSSVAVLEDGEIKFALQEERLNRIKEYAGFPELALAFMLDYLKLTPSDFDAVCLANLTSPIRSRSYYLDSYDINAKTIFEHLRDGDSTSALKRAWRAMPAFVKGAVARKRHEGNNDVVADILVSKGFAKDKIKRTHHHLNHAACAYYGMRTNASDKHLVLTLDGGGDEACSQVYLAENGKMTLIAETPVGHSVGQIYARMTHMMGMRPHEHEYKLMGMAPYSDEKYSRPVVNFLETLLDLDPANPMKFKSKCGDTTYVEPILEKGLRRVRFDSLCGGMQEFAENLMVKWVKACIQQTGVHKVVAAGGVFMNVKANKLISELPEIEFFDVFPSCGDETLGFGAAWLEAIKQDPAINDKIVFNNFYLGPNSDYDLDKAKAEYGDRFDFVTDDNMAEKVANLLADGEIVARACGPMEFGARALGNRTIMADPGRPNVIPTINKMIKMRDFWMPFAPSMLREWVDVYIKRPKSLPDDVVSPWMMHTFDTTDKKDQMMGATHPYDGTARAQVVSQSINPEYHDILTRFAAKKDKGVILNTSFNLHGFPIVAGACDALYVAANSDIRYLLLPGCLAVKK